MSWTFNVFIIRVETSLLLISKRYPLFIPIFMNNFQSFEVYIKYIHHKSPMATWFNVHCFEQAYWFELILYDVVVGLGGLRVTCSPRDPRFAGSNPAEVDGFFQNVKILSTCPPGHGGLESEISGSLKNLKPEKIGLWAKFNRHIHVLVGNI